MKKLDWYILRYFLAALVMAFFAMSGLYMVIHFFTNLGDFMELTQVNLAVFMGQYYLCRLPLILYQITPIIILIAAVMTIAKLLRTSELIPIITSGISVYRLLVPILIVAGIFSVLMFIMDEYTIAALNKAINRTDKILKAEGTELFVPRQTKHYTIVIQKYDYIKNAMHNIWVTEYNNDGLLMAQISAKTAQWREQGQPAGETDSAVDEPRQGRGWYLSDGVAYTYDEKGRRAGAGRIFGARGYFLPPELTPEFMEKTEAASYESLSELDNLIKQFPHQTVFKIKYYTKFSFPLATFALIFTGIPFILLSPGRRNFFRGIGICIAVSLGFFLLKFLLEALSKKNIIPPFLASWLPIIIFGVIAVYLARKMRM